jgi:hypothetical protein
LLDLRETWENSTKEERKDLVHIMIQEVGVDVTVKCVLWVKARPDYEPLFSILDGMRQDTVRRFWIEPMNGLRDEDRNGGQASTFIGITMSISQNA